MGRIVGIDLGTTYSAVVIPEARTGDRFYSVRSCPGYTVIMDERKNRICPSVIAEDAFGKIVAGRTAKNRAGYSPEPIMFAKRSMGEDKVFQLDKCGEMTPIQVSAEILRYLKKLAEDALGEPVDEAVITVPAYFHLRAKQATEEAGKLAGLKVAQVAQEPVAAALMYCMGNAQDPLRVMTYDLGGGTFDIAILEKKDGTITSDSVLSFDGDRFLGGYDFDKMLVEWMLQKIAWKGYDLVLDLDNPKDRIIQSKLMVIAERVKIRLSQEEEYQFQEGELAVNDRNAKEVSLDGISITREEFENMIAPKIAHSIDLCFRALTKVNPPIPPESLDEILMVGGSSRIPMISKCLEEKFGKKPRLVEPDLCVALGAAIIAGTKSKMFGRLRLDTIPTETDLPWLTVTGRVEPEGEGQVVEGFTIRLAAADGSFQSARKTNRDGAFVFEGVPLAAEDNTDFSLTAASPDGAEIGSHAFTVHQSEQAKPGLIDQVEIQNILSKPIFMEVVGGMYMLAPERTLLPYKTMVAARTADVSGLIKIPIYEENNPLGEIVLNDIPRTLPVGSKVEVEVAFQGNYQIHGRAYVPSLARETSIVIDIPVPVQRSLDAMRQDFDRLAARADDALRVAGAGARFGGANAKRLKDYQQEVRDMLQSKSPELPMIEDRLDQIESLIREMSVGWRPQPPRATFEAKVYEANELLEQAVANQPQVAQDGYDKQIEAIRAEADKAFQAQNAAGWKDAYTRLEGLCAKLEPLAAKRGGGGGSQPQQDPGMLLMSLAQSLTALEREARAADKYKANAARFQELAEGLKKIDPRAPNAMSEIRDWYFTGFEELRKRLDATSVTIDGLVEIQDDSQGGTQKR